MAYCVMKGLTTGILDDSTRFHILCNRTRHTSRGSITESNTEPTYVPRYSYIMFGMHGMHMKNCDEAPGAAMFMWQGTKRCTWPFPGNRYDIISRVRYEALCLEVVNSF